MNVMIDLETLGTKPGGAILEIAAATFGCDKPVTFAVEIDLLSSIACGLTVDASTAAFHLRHAYEGHLRGRPLPEAILRLTVWLMENAPGAEVWAWGMDFERSMMQAACEAVGLNLPWHYTAGLDARTVWNVAFPDKKPPARPHRAGLDVAAQIADLTFALDALKGGRP